MAETELLLTPRGLETTPNHNKFENQLFITVYNDIPKLPTSNETSF